MDTTKQQPARYFSTAEGMEDIKLHRFYKRVKVRLMKVPDAATAALTPCITFIWSKDRNIMDGYVLSMVDLLTGIGWIYEFDVALPKDSPQFMEGVSALIKRACVQHSAVVNETYDMTYAGTLLVVTPRHVGILKNSSHFVSLGSTMALADPTFVEMYVFLSPEDKKFALNSLIDIKLYNTYRHYLTTLGKSIEDYDTIFDRVFGASQVR